MSSVNPIKLELLAPAKDLPTAVAAINCGADAVYIGAMRFGARQMASNDIDEIARLVDYAHKFNVKIYVTVNTIIYEDELHDVEALVTNLYRIGVDALIVQDMALLRMNLPPIALHSSTQCDLRTAEKAQFLQDVGFSQLVLARELTISEIKAIRAVTNVPLEVFIHGALCVSYSGRCQLSHVAKDRSANRGACAQMCRLRYDLTDESGRVIERGLHLLSLKDLNQTENIATLVEAGATSFKIEGRLKDANYVKNVVSHYNRVLNELVERSGGKYVRASVGECVVPFDCDVKKSFNRGFTQYFLKERRPNATMASLFTPKTQGEFIGKVKSSKGKTIIVETQVQLHNGDGLSYFDERGEYCGFRVNVAERNKVICNSELKIKPGTKLYRTYDKAFDDVLISKEMRRKISVDFELRTNDNTLILKATDCRGNEVVKTLHVGKLQVAQKNQAQRQIETLSKLGDTIYAVRNIVVDENIFIPASALSALKRDVIAGLDVAQRVTYEFEYRRTENKNAKYIADRLNYADNVANSLAEKFYRSHGVSEIEPALETGSTPVADKPLMHTRYCIRRELGACRMLKNAKRLPEKLFLKTGNLTLAIDCDCVACEMKLRIVK